MRIKAPRISAILSALILAGFVYFHVSGNFFDGDPDGTQLHSEQQDQ